MLVAMLVVVTDAKRTHRSEDRPEVAPHHIHLDLRLDLGSEPVTGELVPRGGSPMPFSGYADLIAALGRISDSDGAEKADRGPVKRDTGAGR